MKRNQNISEMMKEKFQFTHIQVTDTFHETHRGHEGDTNKQQNQADAASSKHTYIPYIDTKHIITLEITMVQNLTGATTGERHSRRHSRDT